MKFLNLVVHYCFYQRQKLTQMSWDSFAVLGWLDVFTRNPYKDILIESLTFCQRNKGMEIIAWCIMTNHIHLIFRSVKGEKPEQLLGDFKIFLLVDFF